MRSHDSSQERDPDNPVIGQDDRPLGDTSEAHDEISPHDLPIDHPGRKAAEHLAEERDADRPGEAAGTTSGHEDPARAGRHGDGDGD